MIICRRLHRRPIRTKHVYEIKCRRTRGPRLDIIEIKWPNHTVYFFSLSFIYFSSVVIAAAGVSWYGGCVGQAIEIHICNMRPNMISIGKKIVLRPEKKGVFIYVSQVKRSDIM